MILLAVALIALAGRAAPSCAAVAIEDGAFVKAAGSRFVLRDALGKDPAGAPFRFIGANFDPLHGEVGRRRFRETLSALSADGITVGRIWAFGEGPADASTWLRQNHLFRAGPDGYIEEAYRHLDAVLAEARRLGIRLIITLSNHWKDYGGAPMYLSWAGLPSEGLAYEAFYSDPEVRRHFRAGVDRLLGRTNSVTGVRYIDDPAIFSWEIMNEAQAVTPSGIAARKRFLIEMAAFIRARDPNHLVGPGVALYSTLRERAAWIDVHRAGEFDYCDSHLYPESSRAPDLLRAIRDALDDRAQLAHFVIKKPLLIGEFGFRTDGPAMLHGRPRAFFFDRFLRRIRQDHAGGALVWIYEPFSGTARDYGIYVDRPDTNDVRGAIRDQALAVRSGPIGPLNPRLGAHLGERPLHEQAMVLVGQRRPHAGWIRDAEGAWVLDIPPHSFERARFERAGTWEQGMLSHFYGADVGSVSYRFAAPRPGASYLAIEISARLSSEWPGASAPRDGGSEVVLSVDSRQIASWRVIPDDGIGRVERALIRDAALLRRLARGVHTLTLAVPAGPHAHGVALYGRPTGRAALPAGDYFPLRIRYLAGSP